MLGCVGCLVEGRSCPSPGDRLSPGLIGSWGHWTIYAAWTLKNDGREVFTMPRSSVLRSFVFNHLIHHRGQLTVYLRLQNVPLPSLYGPTADEP